jgi:imidazolonepropionase-like amidohydrolase
MSTVHAVLCAAALAAPAAVAQELRSDLVLRGGLLFDPLAGVARPLGQLHLQADRVLDERPLDAAVAPGVRVIEATGHTVVPGLFDLHAHVAVHGGPMGVQVTVPADDNLRSHLYCGVTSVVDLHASPAMIFPLRQTAAVSLDRARLYAAGAAFTAPGGHGTQFGFAANEVAAADDVGERFAALLPQRPDLIKAILEHGGWGGLPRLPALAEEHLGAIAERARAARLPLFVHVWSLAEAKAAAERGASALAHGVFLGDVDDELIAAMRKSGTAYIPTLSVILATARTMRGESPYRHPLVGEALHPDLADALVDPDLRTSAGLSFAGRFGGQRAQRFFANLKRLADAGVLIGVGTDAGNAYVPHGPGVLSELQLYVEAGLTPAQALHAATLGSAQILGAADYLGTLEPGKLADAVVVAGDPTQDIAAMWEVAHVVKAGRLVDRGALLQRNRERRRPASVRVAGDALPEVLDDFEDGDLEAAWGGTWSASVDQVAPGGKSSAAIEVGDVGGAKVLRVRGRVEPGFQWGAWAGAQLAFDAERKLLVDASRFHGLKLRLRGTERRFTLTLQRAAVKDFNFFCAEVPVRGEWAEVEVPFDRFRQIGFGKAVEAGAHDVAGLNLELRNSPLGDPYEGPFELEVDWIRLY